jgi:hypothetical protein
MFAPGLGHDLILGLFGQLGGLLDDGLGLSPGLSELFLILALELFGGGPLLLSGVQVAADAGLAVGHSLQQRLIKDHFQHEYQNQEIYDLRYQRRIQFNQ